jgi:predicted amidophosphoribosyltransferase
MPKKSTTDTKPNSKKRTAPQPEPEQLCPNCGEALPVDDICSECGKPMCESCYTLGKKLCMSCQYVRSRSLGDLEEEAWESAFEELDKWVEDSGEWV